MKRNETSAVQTPAPLALEAVGDIAPLREALKRAGFTAPAVAQTLGIRSSAEGVNLPVVLRRTEAPTEYNTLVRLFILGQSVTDLSAARALKPMSLPTLLKAGLLQTARRRVKAIGRLAPFEDLYCLSDFTPAETSGPPGRAHVLGVSPSAVSLANLTVRRRQESVFDLGTGCGIQSLLAAPHAAQVVGSDTNPRALNFAAFNARLNGFRNLDWRAGSYFEPVRGRKFDLVVANPPFVISPESSLLYRDGGLPGDAVSQQVVQGVGAHLNEGGYASVLLNWHHQTDGDWHERPWGWLAENGCDGWLIRFADQDVLTYAASWLVQSHRRHPNRYGHLLDRWLKYYRKLGIRRIAVGHLTLRRRTVPENWFRCDTLPEIHGVCPCGDHIQRIFAAEDFLNGLSSEDELMAQRLAIASDVVLDQRLAPRELGWAVETINLCFARGLPFAGNVDVALLRLVNSCDGNRLLRDVITAIAEGPGQNAQTVRQHCLELARKLVRWGMLVPKAMTDS